MADIPPSAISSALQSHVAQRQVSVVRDGEQTQRANANRQGTRQVDASDTTVETSDADTQIHADAQGTGSQGRAFSHPEEPEEPTADESDKDSPSGDEGRHLDLQA